MSFFERFSAFLLVIGGGFATSLALLALYRHDAGGGETTNGKRRRPGFWSFAPGDSGGESLLVLVLASLLGLFLELLLIRWVSSEIRIFAYFKNFVLIAAFLGFGLGFQLSRRRVQPLALLVPLVLIAAAIELPWRPLRNLVEVLPLHLGIFSEVHLWGVPSLTLDGSALLNLSGALVISVAIFGLVAMPFIPIGQLIGWHIEESAKGIRAYTINLLASLAGILLFSALAYLNQPPPVWFLVAGMLAVALFWSHPGLRWAMVVAFSLCVALVGLGEKGTETIYWSPYQKLAIRPVINEGELVSYGLTTNNSWYQQIINLSDSFVASHPELLGGVPPEFSSYNLPYRFFEGPQASLVLGSGMGNDVAAALRNGSGRVTAVEIDPVILDLGRELHFERPYDDPRVSIVVDDARSYIQNTEDRFDLIVFALLDSHTTASHFSNIRIDNYVYTVEALEATRQLLTPEGVLVIKFQAETSWIAGRLEGLLSKVFGYAPMRVVLGQSYSTPGSFFITGSQDTIATALADEGLAAFVRRSSLPPIESTFLTTDDWPFFYQQAPGLPLVVIVLPALLVLVFAFSLRRVGIGRGSFDGHFFFLGAGFLLLEVHIVSRMALLFGTTWVVNALVVAGILLLAVGANLLVEKVRSIPQAVGWAGLLGTILISYLVPLEWFFFDSPWLRALAATVVLCLPVFFAGIVFIRSFAAADFRSEALGWNIFGSLVGGLFESLSLWTGIRSMVLLAAAFYLAAYFFGSKLNRAATGTLSPITKPI
jgi:hypothetical protein